MKDYTTSNLYLSTYLYMKRVKLVNIIKGKKVIFVFEGGSRTAELASEYINDTARCSPLLFKNSLNDLKNVMFRDITLEREEEKGEVNNG